MAKFKVEITETLRKVVEVEAEDETDAYEKVDQMYCESEITLDWEDYDTATYKVLKEDGNERNA